MYKLSPDASARQGGAQGHLAELLPGRQDRRARPQRLGQVDAAADHGRARTPSSAATRSSRPAPRVGLLEQEPQLDETKDVRGNVEDGVARAARPARPLQRAGRQLLRRDRRRVRARCRSRSTPPTPGTSTRSSTRRWTRCACRPATPTSRSSPAASAAAWRSAGCCSRAPDLLLLDEPTNHLDAESVALARAPPRGVQGHRRGRHPRSLLPRQRRRLDPRARPRPRHPVRGQLLVLARAEAGAPRAGGAQGVGAPAHDRRRSSSGCARTPRAGARSPRRA